MRLHMPSHIFVQLGMWDDVIASNIVAYKAADRLAAAKNLPRGREDFHTLSWLQYGYLQAGKFDDAARALATAKAVADKDPSPPVRDGYAAMKARQVVETAKWEALPLATGAVRDGGAPGYDGSAAYVLASALSAAKLGDMTAAKIALDKLTALRTQAESGSNAYRSRPFAVMEKEVAAAIANAQKNASEAERLLKEATDIELTLDPPSGPAGADQALVRTVRRAAPRAGSDQGRRHPVRAVVDADAEPPRRGPGPGARATAEIEHFTAPGHGNGHCGLWIAD